MESTLTYLTMLTQGTHKPEAEILTRAFQTGLRQLWREHMLGRYLHGEISRDEAIETVGIDWVELAERQYKAMKEDMAWGFEG